MGMGVNERENLRPEVGLDAAALQLSRNCVPIILKELLTFKIDYFILYLHWHTISLNSLPNFV